MAFAACGGNNNGGNGDGGNGKPDACVGVECQVVDCAKMSLPPTSISGTVFAPNGTLPLYGVSVYIPRDPLPPFTEGVSCDRCAVNLPGSPVTQTISDEAGNFRLENVPAGTNIPLVVTIGKWRRQITIPSVTECGNTTLGMAETRLPRTKAEGEIPRIALTTGNADSLECLVRKLGIDDSEITTSAGSGRVHYYAGNGVSSFKSGFGGGAGAIPSATPFWSDVNSLKAYDIVFLSCEGGQHPETKPQVALDAMKEYADLGGRVFATHWHNIWVGGNFQDDPSLAPAVWSSIATWDANDGDPGNPILIDEIANPKGPPFATWMQNVMGSAVRDEIQLQNNTGRATSVTLDATKAEMWVKTKGNTPTPQMFQFTTPNEIAADQRCGKVVFSDMHVSGSSSVGNPFPDSCPGGAGSLTLTPQEKALAFMFFDISSCVGGLF
ncbi:MAG: hypothetical protein H6Q90_4458 [Deltaproteobacteria bacterium]|nr:hypothetical protein [Deltaproteobacteria bacterium]